MNPVYVSAHQIASNLHTAYQALDASLKSDWIMSEYPMYCDTLYASEESENLFICAFRPVQDWFEAFIKEGHSMYDLAQTVPGLYDAEELWDVYITFLGSTVQFVRDPSCIRERHCMLSKKWGSLLNLDHTL